MSEVLAGAAAQHGARGMRCYLAAVLSISAQACATAEFGSLFPGNVAQPPALT